MKRVIFFNVFCVLLAACSTRQTQQKSTPKKVPATAKKECDPKNSGRYGDGYGFYKCSAEGKWVIDKEEMEFWAKYEGRKHELVWALRSRVLTVKEMEEVQQYGTSLLTHNMQSYFQADVEKSFDELLAQQFRLQVIAKSHLKCGESKP
jgi:hypothetical protein